jgi:hypothetical protein
MFNKYCKGMIHDVMNKYSSDTVDLVSGVSDGFPKEVTIELT